MTTFPYTFTFTFPAGPGAAGTLVGIAALSAAVHPRLSDTGALVGHGAPAASAHASKFWVTAAPHGHGVLSALVELGSPTVTRSASPNGIGVLSTVITIKAGGFTGAFRGISALSAVVRPRQFFMMGAQGIGALTPTIIQVFSTPPASSGHGVFSATANPIEPASAALTGHGALSVHTQGFVTAAGSGYGALTVSAVAKKFVLAASVAGQGVLSAPAHANKFWVPVGLNGYGTAADIPPAYVEFDTVGSGFTSNGTSAATWFHHAVGGSYVIIQVFSQPAPATVLYGNAPMASLGDSTISSGFGYLSFYGLANAPGGTQTITVNWATGARDVVCNSISYAGVVDATLAQGSSDEYGYSSPATQISCPVNGAVVWAIAGVCTDGTDFYLADNVAGSPRWSNYVNQFTSGPTSAMCIGGDSIFADAEFGAMPSVRAAYVWASAAVVLSSGTLPLAAVRESALLNC